MLNCEPMSERKSERLTECPLFSKFTTVKKDIPKPFFASAQRLDAAAAVSERENKAVLICRSSRPEEA
jgi:hypothetical protein